MLPIPGSLCGITYSVAARIYRGEFDLSPEVRERLEDGLEHLRKVDDVVGDFSPTDLESWPGFADRLAEYGLHEGRIDASTRELRDDFELDRELEVKSWVWRLIEKVKTVRSFEVDESHFELIPIGDVVAGRVADENRKIFIPSGQEKLFWQGIRAMAWRRVDGVVRVSHQQRDVSVGEFQFDDATYFGEEVSYLEDWRAYLEGDIKHRVLVEGGLGQGKTTLWQHAVAKLGARAVCMSAGDFDQKKQCLEVARRLQPDIIIIEGISVLKSFRHGFRCVKQWLKDCFGATLCILTTESLGDVSQELIQPGLLDTVIELGERKPETRRQIVDKLGAEHNLEFSKERHALASKILEEASPGYLNGVLKKVSVFGWDVLQDSASEVGTTETCAVPDRWLAQNNFKVLELELESLFEQLERRLSLKTMFSSEDGEVRVGTLPNGAQIAITHGINTRGFGSQNIKIHWNTKQDSKPMFFDGLAEVFWADRQCTSVTFQERHELKFVESEGADDDYLGTLDRLLPVWETFREEGLTRTVLLQGRPGCGKSTFCRHAAEYLSDRTIALSSDDFSDLKYGEWQSIEKLLQPDCIIIDDVDRLTSNTLDNKLQFLEEGHSSIPFVFFTTNDVGELPAAMKRPGRIDRIIEVEPPGRDERRKLIESFAERVGVEIPSDRFEMLDRVLAEYSHAHLQEVLRRAKIYGWDSDELLDDTTFDKIEYQSELESSKIPF